MNHGAHEAARLQTADRHDPLVHGLSRRNFLAAGSFIAAAMPFAALAQQAVPTAQPSGGGIDDDPAGMTRSQIDANGVSLHVVEIGEGRPVVFCHGFPDTARTWRSQMLAVAGAGYRAVALDMRGYGRSSAPAEAALYTPLHTVGDVIGVMDALGLPTAVIVGHDWGANVAWNAAVMRPDRFRAVFCMSVPHTPRGELSLFDVMREAGMEDRYYMFAQARPEADAEWANAAVTLPGMYYWSSGAPAPGTGWSPFDPARSLTRPIPAGAIIPADPAYVAFNIAEFQRTGFHGALNYYRAIQPAHDLTPAFKGALVAQPSFFLMGMADGLNEIARPTTDDLRAVLPGLVGHVEVEGVGHWPQHEAPDLVNKALLDFLGKVG